MATTTVPLATAGEDVTGAVPPLRPDAGRPAPGGDSADVRTCHALLCAGCYAIGPLFRESPERRQKVRVGIGVVAVIGFIGLRWLNSYGDPVPWGVEARPTYTVLSFLRVRKYPPSLAFLLMTLGPVLIALAWLEHARRRVLSFFVTYGRVPLFFYGAHIYLVHLIAVAVAYGQGGPARLTPPSAGIPGTGQSFEV